MSDIIERAEALLARVAKCDREMDKAPWHSGESKWQSDCVLTGAPDADMTNDGRVVAQANPHFPYRANLDGIAALRNAAPEVVAVIRDLIHDLRNQQLRVIAFQHEYLDETHGDRDPRTVMPSDVAELREAFREQGEAVRDLVPVVTAADDYIDAGGATEETDVACNLQASIHALRVKRGAP